MSRRFSLCRFPSLLPFLILSPIHYHPIFPSLALPSLASPRFVSAPSPIHSPSALDDPRSMLRPTYPLGRLGICSDPAPCSPTAEPTSASALSFPGTSNAPSPRPRLRPPLARPRPRRRVSPSDAALPGAFLPSKSFLIAWCHIGTNTTTATHPPRTVMTWSGALQVVGRAPVLVVVQGALRENEDPHGRVCEPAEREEVRVRMVTRVGRNRLGAAFGAARWDHDRTSDTRKPNSIRFVSLHSRRVARGPIDSAAGGATHRLDRFDDEIAVAGGVGSPDPSRRATCALLRHSGVGDCMRSEGGPVFADAPLSVLHLLAHPCR
ncbi:hypothetical protein MSAN_00286600 [Mycena sanguinolenta]|uniref:Uncharacterized protein n=1 Tax=Mycena sanguinolenta TaxID=230812 RepID=A0A8H6ZAM5_9AGAR|nr:hypothetical protein MSAN_00286600 [Mycena sanguinolenta]